MITPAEAYRRLRGWHWPHSIEGTGGKIGTDYYPHQSTRVPFDRYWTDALTRRSLDMRFLGQRTPWGTPVAAIMRDGSKYHDYLLSPCGRCGQRIDKCQCERG